MPKKCSPNSSGAKPKPSRCHTPTPVPGQHAVYEDAKRRSDQSNQPPPPSSNLRRSATTAARPPELFRREPELGGRPRPVRFSSPDPRWAGFYFGTVMTAYRRR